MDLLKKAVRVSQQKQSTKDVNQEKVQKTIKKSKQAFLEHESHHFLSYPAFILEQGLYIKKRWWLLQGGLLVFFYFLLQIMQSPFYIKRCMGILASTFVILIIPELFKNCNTASMEIEGASYFSLRKLYAARMLLFAVVDVSLLTIFLVTLGIRGQLTAGEMVTSFLLPFVGSCCICFRTFCTQKATSEYTALFLCLIWTFLWIQVVLNETIYTAITVPIWCSAMVLFLAYFLYSICKVWKSCKMIWEVEERWN